MIDYQAESTVRRIADYERISGILWIVLGVLQILTIFGAIAGIWNLFAGGSRISMARLVQRRDPRVPAAFAGVGQLIVIAILNLLLGGVIGIIFVIFDCIIRDKVLANRHLFVPGAAAMRPAFAAAPSVAARCGFDAELRALVQLRRDGIINDSEFELKKADILRTVGAR